MSTFGLGSVRGAIFGLLAGLTWVDVDPVSAQDIEPVPEPLDASLRSEALLPETVLRSSALRFPSILESFEREAAARSDQLSADGAFDLMLEAEYYDRFTGYYSGGFGSVKATQQLEPYGAKVFGSYRISDGDFPTYENYYNTNQAGEFKIGALFSLLRDRDIDKRRFAIEDTRLATNQARLDVLLVQLKVQHEALKAYWTWVAAGREIRVYEELLEIAQARAVGLAREFEAGAIAQIAVTENQQNVLRRKTLLEQAKRNFQTAANSLSYYLRDSEGRLVTPTRAQLPPEGAIAPLPNAQQLVEGERNAVLDNRPELLDFKIALERARNKVELSRNDMQPRLDASIELSRDFGAIGDGGPGFNSTDTVVGVTLTVPLQRREARGKLQRAESELRELELRQRRISDQIEVELDNILVNLSASLRLADLADQEVAQARTMVNAERKRFRLGAGDFFLVNLREESSADAQIRAIRAELTGRLATASFNAATMDLDALGLE